MYKKAILKKIAFFATRTMKYTYDLNNNRTGVGHADNVWFNYQFDGLNRVSIKELVIESEKFVN